MIYVVYGNEEYLINKYLNSIIFENKNSDISKIDGSDKSFNIDELIDNYCNVGLLAENKLILVKNPYFLNKKIDDNELNKLKELIDNQSFESILVLYSYDGFINDKLKAFKEISNNAHINKFVQLKKQDFYRECYSILNENKLTLDKSLVNTLINSSNGSLTIFNQNIEVLSLYPEKIDIDVINGLLISNNDEEVFNLINAITNKNISLAIKYARKILKNDNNINGLLSLIAGQLRFLYEVSYLRNQGLSTNEIADRTSIKNSYRIEKAFESLNTLKENEILRLLDYLANLDLKIKTNAEIDDNLQLEMFIVRMMNYE